MRKLALALSLVFVLSPLFAESVTITHLNPGTDCDHVKIQGNTSGKFIVYTRASLQEAIRGGDDIVALQIKSYIRRHVKNGGAVTWNAIKNMLEDEDFIFP